mgnify:CR=1 FL=1
MVAVRISHEQAIVQLARVLDGRRDLARSVPRNVIEENGGFISCRSPIINPPIDLSGFVGIQIDVEGNGHKLKFAISCRDKITSISDFISGGIRWVAEFETGAIGNTVIKSSAKKVRKIEKRNVIAGFAGSTADALTLFERLEAKLEKHAGNLTRAAVELAKDWRTDKYLRRLEALMAIADKEKSFIISGTGDVLEPEDGLIGIGSGGNYALAAAKVLKETNLSAEDIAKKSIKVASEICVFTNNNITIEKIKSGK